MRILLLTSLLVLFLPSGTSAQSPPLSMVTVKGRTDTRFNRVSLFASGGAHVPFRTEDLSAHRGQYSINVNIPSDMRKKANYYFTDMRFWGDNNNNGVKDPGEPISQCHFIMWVPAARKVYMQVYQGKRYPIESPVLTYHYKSR